jgi:5-methylthioadenosine/S-adenosylhomocysteine deaminase
LDEYGDRCDGRVRAWVMLACGTGMRSEELLVGAATPAETRGAWMTYHESGRQAQVDASLRDHGMRPIEYLDQVGALGRVCCSPMRCASTNTRSSWSQRTTRR